MVQNNFELFQKVDIRPLDVKGELFLKELESLREFGTYTQTETLTGVGLKPIPVFINEFWTAKQRVAHSLHEISYRACFKPQLPRFFIERLTKEGDLVYDPFMGRGTTLLEGALLGRNVAGCDINPLSTLLLSPRFHPPELIDVQERLQAINLAWDKEIPEDLLVFYHPDTLRQICALRNYFLKKEKRQC